MLSRDWYDKRRFTTNQEIKTAPSSRSSSANKLTYPYISKLKTISNHSMSDFMRELKL